MGVHLSASCTTLRCWWSPAQPQQALKPRDMRSRGSQSTVVHAPLRPHAQPYTLQEEHTTIDRSFQRTPAVKQRMLPAWSLQPHTLSHTSA